MKLVNKTILGFRRTIIYFPWNISVPRKIVWETLAWGLLKYYLFKLQDSGRSRSLGRHDKTVVLLRIIATESGLEVSSTRTNSQSVTLSLNSQGASPSAEAATTGAHLVTIPTALAAKGLGLTKCCVYKKFQIWSKKINK